MRKEIKKFVNIIVVLILCFILLVACTPNRVYTDEEKIPYTPVSVTVSLYDAKNEIYGFTCNTSSKPLKPVLQVQKGESLTNQAKEYEVEVKQHTSIDENENFIVYYVIKAQAKLDANTTYSYRIYDKEVDTGTEIATIQTKDVKSQSFSFAHISDTQVSTSTGKRTGGYLAQILSKVVGKNDFILHTGDVVQNGAYEEFWKSMLNDNFEYLSKIPFMAVSGNHETAYANCNNETFKHFNYLLPEQASTGQGFFYSFEYGNAKFIMLNTNGLSGRTLKLEQYRWLKQELENNTSLWTIVALHNPIYSVGKYGSNPEYNSLCLGLRSQLHELFVQHGVDIVLQGHDHKVSRTYPINANGEPTSENLVTENGIKYSVNPDGVIYLMNGPGGNQTRTPSSVDSSIYKYACASKPSSWANIEISGNTLTVTPQYADGEKTQKYYTTWGIKKETP